MTNRAFARCRRSGSWRARWWSRYERPGPRTRAGQARGAMGRGPVRHVPVLPGGGEQPRARAAAEAGAGSGAHRGWNPPAGAGRPRGPGHHPAHGRPLPGARLAPARRQRHPGCAGGFRQGDRGSLGRGRVGEAKPAGARPARACVLGHRMIAGRLRFETSHATEFVDVTRLVREEVRRSGLRTGRVHLQSLHTTLGLAINENEPLLLRDFQTLLERLAPAGAGYEHDDFARRYEISVDEPVNGHAHCRQLLLTGFATLLVEEGKVVLGRWQSVFAVELDGPRHRELAMQLDGDFLPPHSVGRSVSRSDAGWGAGWGESLLEVELARQLMVDPDPVALPMRRLMEAGGKRLRPKLVQLTSQIGPRHDPLRAASLAAAVELLHNATLIHDDYVDESTHRRGRPTVAAAEGAERAIAV